MDVPALPGATFSDYRQLLIQATPLLDVRAPVEFIKGSFPESINLPLMTDEERHLVGLRYKEAGQAKAIELGAQLVNSQLRQERIQLWKEYVQSHPSCVLYCFRGGLRSRITQQWLQDVGIQIPLLTGGYKALRTFIIQSLEELTKTINFTLIGGRTGNGKTLLINKLGSAVDLEALAGHRGSSFGRLITEQPSNIDFENALCVELLRCQERGILHLFLEDEARLIGRVCIPDIFRNAMQQAPIVILDCDLESRIRNCFDDYVPDLLARYVKLLGDIKGFSAFREHHLQSLFKIRKRFGSENYNHAVELLKTAMDQHENHNDSSGYDEFIALLLTKYYDPMYDYQLSQKAQRIVFTGVSDEVINWASSQ